MIDLKLKIFEMKIKHDLIPLFKMFIKDTQNGKRMKKDGTRISSGTINNYQFTLKNLERFVWKTNFELRGCIFHKLTGRELISEKNYWKKLNKRFSSFLHSRGNFDNSVGANMKTFRSFVIYLKQEKGLDFGDFYKHLYVRHEEVQILVLSPERIKFMIIDKKFDETLNLKHKFIKDIFIFGCTTGLRYSDLMNLTNKNFSKDGENYYLHALSIKTKSRSAIKLPDYAVDIYKNYKPRNSTSPLFKKVGLSNFNDVLKSLGEKAGFTEVLANKRDMRGVQKDIYNRKNRFCDRMSSHMMRRTSITTLLILGVPELLVRKISGHKDGSKSFYRYVDFARTYMDDESQKAFDKLIN